MGRTSDARDRLIASGAELMHHRGYTAVGVSELCSQAGVQKGSFYHFFPSKVELAMAVIDRFHAATEEAFAELARGSAPPLQRLKAHAEGIRELQSALQESCGRVLGCPIGNLTLEMSAQEPALADRLAQVVDRNEEIVAQVLQEAVDRGEIDPLDPPRAARSVLALIEGSIMLAKLRDDPEVLQDLATDVLRLVGAPIDAH